MPESTVIAGNKRITELQTLAKLTGKEEVLIDNGDETYKITVDSLGNIRYNKFICTGFKDTFGVFLSRWKRKSGSAFCFPQNHSIFFSFFSKNKEFP